MKLITMYNIKEGEISSAMTYILIIGHLELAYF